jgi:hypothetical protein
LSGFSALFVWYHSALFPAIEIKRKGVRDMMKDEKFLSSRRFTRLWGRHLQEFHKIATRFYLNSVHPRVQNEHKGCPIQK